MLCYEHVRPIPIRKAREGSGSILSALRPMCPQCASGVVRVSTPVRRSSTMAFLDLTFAETLKLIASFRKHPIIYDLSAIGYNDRKMKANAWQDVADEVGIRPDLCKKKMQSLMASYRKEKKSAQRAKDDGNETYQVKWRYWNHFKFLRGLADDEEDPLGSVPDDIPEPKSESPWSIAKMLAHKYRDVAYPIEPVAKTDKKSKVVDDEYTVIGNAIETKLKKLSKAQRIYAENIINQILYRGLIFQLSRRSEIRDSDFPPCSTQNEVSKPESDRSGQCSSHTNTSTQAKPEECHFSAFQDQNIPMKRKRDYSPDSMSADSPDTYKEMTIL